MSLSKSTVAAALWLITCLLGQAIAQPTYQFLSKISLPGDGKWDYLKMDGERERLFVSHGDRIHIIDLKTDAPIGEITGLKGVHGIGLAKDLTKGYITNGTDNTITVFDYNTFKVLQTIQVDGKKADAVLYDKFSKQIFVFNNGSGNAIVIDAVTDQVVGKIEMGGAPEFACTNDKGSVFNNNEDTNEIFEIDTKTLTVKHKFSLAPNEVATGLTIDVANNRLFSVCRKTKTLVILDASTGKIIQALPIGGGVDGVIYDKDLKLIITSNGEGSATIVHQDTPDQYRVVQTLATKPGQKTIVHRGTTHRIFLSGADYKEGTKELLPGTFGVSVYGPKAN
ncbi:YncE family protein [Fibrella arboris]|uniref:YncE family protein n=1 Tax=Fibrella arboris TaxID=3242486 RepID=UPI0035228297